MSVPSKRGIVLSWNPSNRTGVLCPGDGSADVTFRGDSITRFTPSALRR
jgi:hypothetical protein